MLKSYIQNKLNEKEQSILRDLSRKYFNKLTQLSREDNEKSLELIRSTGITITTINDPDQIDKFNRAGEKARRSLVGKLYDQELLKKIEDTLTEYRVRESENMKPDSPKLKGTVQ